MWPMSPSEFSQHKHDDRTIQLCFRFELITISLSFGSQFEYFQQKVQLLHEIRGAVRTNEDDLF